MAVTYGWVVGSMLQPIADTETAEDRTPADRPSAGEVILTPLVAATADGKLIARAQIRRPLDADGRIVDLDGADGVAVPVGSYRVEWALTAAAGVALDKILSWMLVMARAQLATSRVVSGTID